MASLAPGLGTDAGVVISLLGGFHLRWSERPLPGVSRASQRLLAFMPCTPTWSTGPPSPAPSGRRPASATPTPTSAPPWSAWSGPAAACYARPEYDKVEDDMTKDELVDVLREIKKLLKEMKG